jgi:MoxR-like ATPase
MNMAIDTVKAEMAAKRTGKANGEATRVSPEPATAAQQPAVDLADFRSRFKAALAQLDGAFVGRAEAVRCLGLAMLTRNNCLFVGEPGTAKTALVERFLAHVVDARLFAALCGSFTTLDELAGPPDIQAFQKGQWRRVVSDMLPEADVAFLDEVMKSNDGAINMLLSVLNERRFDGRAIPLRAMFAATNWPEVKQRTEKVQALYDRFVLRHHVQRCAGPEHTKMLACARGVAAYRPAATFTLSELDAAAEDVARVTVPEVVLGKLTDIIARLAKDEVAVSDRRSVKAVEVLCASAWLDGRTEASLEDFDALKFVLWQDEPHIAAVAAILDTLDKETVKKCVSEIDACRGEFAQLKKQSRECRLGRAPQLLKRMTDVANDAKERVAKEGATARGKEQVRQALAALRDDFKALRDEVRKELSLDVDVDK